VLLLKSLSGSYLIRVSALCWRYSISRPQNVDHLVSVSFYLLSKFPRYRQMKRYLNIPSCLVGYGEACLQNCEAFTCHDLQYALNSIDAIGDSTYTSSIHSLQSLPTSQRMINASPLHSLQRPLGIFAYTWEIRITEKNH